MLVNNAWALNVDFCLWTISITIENTHEFMPTIIYYLEQFIKDMFWTFPIVLNSASVEQSMGRRFSVLGALEVV